MLTQLQLMSLVPSRREPADAPLFMIAVDQVLHRARD
jgi:hypothetical protein